MCDQISNLISPPWSPSRYISEKSKLCVQIWRKSALFAHTWLVACQSPHFGSPMPSFTKLGPFPHASDECRNCLWPICSLKLPAWPSSLVQHWSEQVYEGKLAIWGHMDLFCLIIGAHPIINVFPQKGRKLGHREEADGCLMGWRAIVRERRMGRMRGWRGRRRRTNL